MMAESMRREHRARTMILEAEAAAWLESHPPPTDTSIFYNTLLALPFLSTMSQRDMITYVYVCELALQTAFSMGRRGLPLPLPRSQSECSCADLNDLDVQKIHISGSARERSEVYIFADEASDIDLMFQLGPISVDGPGKRVGLGAGHLETEAADPCTQTTPRSLEVTQESTNHPGFVLLRHRRLESCRHSTSLPLDASKVIGLMDSFRLQATRQPSSQSGPSLSSSCPNLLHACQTSASIDLVACILCPTWPYKDFATRQKPSGFPAVRLVERLCRTPAFLVPVGFRGSPTEKLEWRLSFSRHEYIVYRSMKKEQQLCLTTLKHCRAAVGEAAKPLKSYYLKTALLWMAESRAADQWTLATMHDSLLLILRYLDVCLRRGYLPCYFWPEVNLFASRSDAELTELAAAVDGLRQRLLPAALALMADWLGQPAATLAQTLLVDGRWVPSRQLNAMAYVSCIRGLGHHDPGPLLRMLELFGNGRMFSGERMVPMPGLLASLVQSSSLAKISGDPMSGAGLLSSVISVLELCMRGELKDSGGEEPEDSWMAEE